MSSSLSYFVDLQLASHVEILDHNFELIVGYLSIVVEVSFDYSAVDQLLQLEVGQVVAHHHFQHCEELAVGDVAVLIDIVDLECEFEFMLLVGAIEGGQAWMGKGVPERN